MKFARMFLAATAIATFSTAANATDLFNQVGGPSSTQTISFVAGAPNTTVSFGGYDVPSFSSITDIYLYADGSSTNLLGTNFDFTPAASGSFAFQDGVGAYGTSNLTFAGVSAGFFDQFSQNVATAAGASYTLGFSANFASGNSALRVGATDASVAGAVPEPATWALMLMGFGGMGFSMRRQRATARLAAA